MSQTVKIGDLCDLQNGFAFKSQDYVEHSNTLNIRMSNIRPNGVFDEEHNLKYLPDSYSEKYREFLLKDGDLIVAMTDMAGEPKILGLPTLVKNTGNRKFLLNQRVGKLYNFSDDIYVPYLRYCMSSFKDYYKNKGTGGLQINISKKDILSAPIYLPKLEEQQSIAAKLDAAFSEIDKEVFSSKQRFEQINALKNSVFEKIINNYNNTADKIELINICAKITDGSHFSPKTSEKGYPYITVKDIINDEINFAKCKFINKQNYEALKRNGCSPKIDDILFSKDGTVGKVSIIKEDIEFVVLSSLAIITPNLKLIYPKYLFYYLKSERFISEAIGKKTGVAIKRIILKNLKKIKIILPSLKEQKEVVHKLDNIYEQIKLTSNSSLNKITLLKKLKNSFLSQYLNNKAA